MKKTVHFSKNRFRKDNANVAEIVDRYAELTSEIRGAEKEKRAFRTEAIQAGRLDLARQFLGTPIELRDLADFLWYGVALVTVRRPANIEPGPIKRKFQRKFTMERFDGELRPFTKSREDALARYVDTLKEMASTKNKSDLSERSKAAARKDSEIMSQPRMIRELAIETAWWYPLEEWAMIFPDAALARDYDFIKRIVERCTHPQAVLDFQYSAIALSWHGFEWLALASRVPPLKHWSDKAACEFVRFMSGETMELSTYQQRKRRLGLHSEKPTLVGSAMYSHDGKSHRLVCER